MVEWMKDGGNLLTVSGAASGDRYSQPTTVISSATGIVEAPRQRKMIQWTSKLTAVDTGAGDLGAFTAYGVRGNVTDLPSSGLKQLAKFSDGSPAVVQNTAVGKGTATHFSFLPGIRFRNQASSTPTPHVTSRSLSDVALWLQNPYRSDPFFNSVVNYTDGSLPYLLHVLNESGVVPRVTVSATQVSTQAIYPGL